MAIHGDGLSRFTSGPSVSDYGLLGSQPPQAPSGGLLGMDPYQLAQIYSLMTATRGSNVGLTVANLESQRQSAEMQRRQAAMQQWRFQQEQQQAQKQTQLDSLAQRSFAPGVTNLTPNDDEGNAMPTGGGGGLPAYIQGAMQIDPSRALQMQQLMAKDSPYGKVEPKDYTPESVARFNTTRNYADLMPRSKVEVSGGMAFDPFNTKPGSFLAGPESDVIPDGRGGFIANPAKLALRKAGSTQVSVDQRLENRESADKGALNVKNYGDLQTAAGSARKENSLLSAMERNPIDTSKAAPVTTTAMAWLASAGLGGEQAKRIASNAQQFNAAAMELVLQKQLAQKGPQTESDARRLEQTVASLGNTREANSAIIAFSKAANNKTIAQERFYADWWRKHRTYEGADSAWFAGEGGRSVWDDASLARYGVVSPARAPQQQPATIDFNSLPR